MKTILLISAALLTGCASPKWLENRVACTVARDEAHIVSKWGPFSIGAQVAASDAKVMCGG